MSPEEPIDQKAPPPAVSSWENEGGSGPTRRVPPAEPAVPPAPGDTGSTRSDRA
jgi:hypothetical protein